MGNTGFDVDLHNGWKLNLEEKPNIGLDYNEECRWAEDYDVICKGKHFYIE